MFNSNIYPTYELLFCWLWRAFVIHVCIWSARTCNGCNPMCSNSHVYDAILSVFCLLKSTVTPRAKNGSILLIYLFVHLWKYPLYWLQLQTHFVVSWHSGEWILIFEWAFPLRLWTRCSLAEGFQKLGEMCVFCSQVEPLFHVLSFISDLF